MFCQSCGKQLSEGALTCPSCGQTVMPPAPPKAGADPTQGSRDSVEDLLVETKRAAVALAKASARVSERLFAKADAAAKGSGISARSAAREAAKELERARKEIERVLDRLK